MNWNLIKRFNQSWTTIKFLAKIVIGIMIFSAAPKSTAPAELTVSPMFFATAEDYAAACIYFEAKGEGRKGMQAVASVLNWRLLHKNYPATMKEVIWQNKQFSWTHQLSYDVQYKVITGDLSGFNKVEQKSYEQAKIIARMPQKQLLAVFPRSTMYFHADYVAPSWSKEKTKVAKIGRHIFYKEKSIAKRK